MITKFQLYCEATEYKLGNLNVLYRDENLTVVVPLTVSASTITCRGTKWCSSDEAGFKQWTKKHVLIRFLFHDGYKLRLTWKFDFDPPTKYYTDKNYGSWGSGGGKYGEIKFGKYPFILKGDVIDEIEEEYERIKKGPNYNDQMTTDWGLDGKSFQTTNKEYYDSWYNVKKEIVRRVAMIPQEAIKRIISYRKYMIKNKETIQKGREYDELQKSSIRDLEDMFVQKEPPKSYYHDYDDYSYIHPYQRDMDDYFAEN